MFPGVYIATGIWAEILTLCVFPSFSQTTVSQIEHLLQTAEAIRRDGQPEWMQVTGLVHDLGKLLFFFGSQGQWDVVGDTFVVGCRFSEKIIYPETFKNNPDWEDAVYSTEYGIYKPRCGLDNVMLSWGHDEVSRRNSLLSPCSAAVVRYDWEPERPFLSHPRSSVFGALVLICCLPVVPLQRVQESVQSP